MPGACSFRDLGQIIALWLLLLQGQGNPRPRLGITWIHKVGEIQATHTHTHIHRVSGTLIAAAANINWDSARETEGFYLHLRGGRSQLAMNVRDSWLFGEVVCTESWTVTRCCNGSAQRDFLKVQLRCGGQGPCVLLPCPQQERIEGTICSHSVHLVRKIRKVHSEVISRTQSGAAGKAEAVQSGELVTLSASRSVRLGTGRAGDEHLGSLTVRQSPLPSAEKGRSHPAPTSCRIESTCKTGRKGSRTPCRVYIYKRKTERGTPKGPILKFSQEDKIHLVPRALFQWGQQNREIRNWFSKGESGPCSLGLHTELPSTPVGKNWPSYTDWPLPWSGQLIHQKLYIIGNKLGHTKIGGAGEGGIHAQFSQKTEQCLLGESKGSHPPYCNESPSRGRWRWYRRCCRKLDHPPWDPEMIQRQRQMQKDKSEGKHQIAETNFTSFLCRICIFSSFHIAF